MAHQSSFHLLFADHSHLELLVQSKAAEGSNNTTTFELLVVSISIAEERATSFKTSHPPTAEVNMLRSDSTQVEVDEATRVLDIKA